MPIKAAVRALPATPPVISLLTSAAEIPEADARWEAGVSYESETCGLDRTGAFAACNVSTVDPTPGSATFNVDTITVWAVESCSSLGSTNRDWQGRVLRKLAACESSQVESELWRGDIARAESFENRFLASSEATIITSSPATPADALACLEGELSRCNCGGQGMIHATPEVVSHWIANNMVVREGSKLFTHLGTVVVPGSGYDGSGPGASPVDDPVVATSTQWAYATSMVHFRRGPASVLPSDPAQALDRSTNTYVFWAQRTFEFGWDCCLIAAEIDVPLCAAVS